MVVPSSLNRTSGSTGSKSFKTTPAAVERNDGQHSLAEITKNGSDNNKLHEETWFAYFFGPSPEETRQQPQQKSDSTLDSQPEGRDAAAVSVDERTTNTQTDLGKTQEKETAYPGWLSWIDPASSTGGCVSSSRPPAQLENGTTPAQFENGTTSATSKPFRTGKQGRTREQDEDEKVEVISEATDITTVRVRSIKEASKQDPKRQLIDPPAGSTDAASVDSSVDESKMFRDLDSVQSTKLGTIAGSVRTVDLDLYDGASTTMGSISESGVGNKLANFKMSKGKGRDKTIGGDLSTKKGWGKVDSAKSLEARRQILVNKLRTTIATHGRYDVKTANISAALGDLLDESKQYEQAIKLNNDAVEIYSSKLGDDHSTTMEAKLQLAKVLENANQLDEAINIYFLVTVMRRALDGEKDPSSADSLVLVARALRKKDGYHQAIKELKRALKVYREALGDGHAKVSTTVDEIASLYVTIGDFEKSAAILEEVVKLKAVTQGMQSKGLATTLCSLSTAYECSEDFTKAMKSLKKAYKIYTEMGGYSSKDATNTLNRIAQLYEATGDYDRASITYLGVLRGRKINFGDDHLQVAETYYKLGHALRESGQYEKALKCLKEGLPIYVNKGVEINDVEMIAEVMHEMALINKERKRFNEAARIFKQELGVRRKIGHAEYPMIARTLNHLGVTEYEMKNNNKSLKYLVEALTIFKDRAEGSVECAEVLFNTGLVFESSKNRERAMEAHDEAARIFKEHGYK